MKTDDDDDQDEDYWDDDDEEELDELTLVEIPADNVSISISDGRSFQGAVTINDGHLHNSNDLESCERNPGSQEIGGGDVGKESMNRGEIDGFFCPIFFEAWTSGGSHQIWYADNFRFYGDFLDKKDVDITGRRKTRIIAIDALYDPGQKQYRYKFLLREINKAFCGFSESSKSLSFEDGIGIVTGNWGCGAFEGDPELKAILQWLAASQALRPFMVYYTSKMEALEKVTKWIMEHRMNVGELWNLIVKYSSQRFKRETRDGFLKWFLHEYLNVSSL